MGLFKLFIFIVFFFILFTSLSFAKGLYLKTGISERLVAVYAGGGIKTLIDKHILIRN